MTFAWHSFIEPANAQACCCYVFFFWGGISHYTNAIKLPCNTSKTSTIQHKTSQCRGERFQSWCLVSLLPGHKARWVKLRGRIPTSMTVASPQRKGKTMAPRMQRSRFGTNMESNLQKTCCFHTKCISLCLLHCCSIGPQQCSKHLDSAQSPAPKTGPPDDSPAGCDKAMYPPLQTAAPKLASPRKPQNLKSLRVQIPPEKGF